MNTTHEYCIFCEYEDKPIHFTENGIALVRWERILSDGCKDCPFADRFDDNSDEIVMSDFTWTKYCKSRNKHRDTDELIEDIPDSEYNR